MTALSDKCLNYLIFITSGFFVVSFFAVVVGGLFCFLKRANAVRTKWRKNLNILVKYLTYIKGKIKLMHFLFPFFLK